MTESEHSPWMRKHFAPGSGDALLFCVVFGKIDQTVALSGSTYRVAGVPPELEIMAYNYTNHADVLSQFRTGYVWDLLVETKTPFAQEIAKQQSCTVLRGTFKDPQKLEYLRDTIGLITHMLDQGGVAVYDPQILKWWSPNEWRHRVFEPASAVPRHHVVILYSEDGDGTEWFHTRGMRKFGRPDLSMHGVTSEHRTAVIDLFERFIEMQAFGALIPEGQEIRMRTLPQGLRCFHGGSPDDPDFNNVHIEIRKT